MGRERDGWRLIELSWGLPPGDHNLGMEFTKALALACNAVISEFEARGLPIAFMVGGLRLSSVSECAALAKDFAARTAEGEEHGVPSQVLDEFSRAVVDSFKTKPRDN